MKVFRVDNPHQGHQLLALDHLDVKKSHPDVLFLAEAFTKPAMMHQLARVGFTQSYTYFTWRTQKWEIEQYGRNWPHRALHAAELLRQHPTSCTRRCSSAAPPMFKIRAVLAAMMSPTWGVYYLRLRALRARRAQAGSEEYLDTEKFQLRPRDYDGAVAQGGRWRPT